MSSIADIINEAFEQRSNISARGADQTLKDAVNEAIAGLDRGELRVAEKQNGEWVVNQWLKKAVLLSFALNDNRVMEDGCTRYYDKVEPKFAGYGKGDFSAGGMRVVPPATVRYGSYVAPNVVLMPSYVNIGAYVDSGTMVDNLGHRGFLRPGGQKRAPVRRCGPGRRPGAAAGQPDHHRGPLFYRGAFGNR